MILSVNFRKKVNKNILQRLNHFWDIRKDLIRRYSQSNDGEILEIIDYFKKNPLNVFPYDFVYRYVYLKPKVYKDIKSGLYYVYDNGNKMYFKRSINSIRKVRTYYNGICLEQDKESPHCYGKYITDEDLSETILDIGVAEGNFSLAVVKKAKKIIMFECDDEWIEALELTFMPFKDKVEIHKAYVTNKDGKDCITIDKFAKDNDINISLIKMDIEGEEIAALKGAKNYLDSCENIKLITCSYHNKDDEENIKLCLSNFDNKVSKGYMIFINKGDKVSKDLNPRRGLVISEKKHG